MLVHQDGPVAQLLGRDVPQDGPDDRLVGCDGRALGDSGRRRLHRFPTGGGECRGARTEEADGLPPGHPRRRMMVPHDLLLGSNVEDEVGPLRDLAVDHVEDPNDWDVEVVRRQSEPVYPVVDDDRPARPRIDDFEAG